MYGWWLRSVKIDSREKARESNLAKHTLLKLPSAWEEDPPAGLTWYDEREFRYRGVMYDVIRSERHGDYTWYYVYRDAAETELLDQIASYVSGSLKQNPDVDRQRSSLGTFLKLVCLVVQPASVAGLQAVSAAAPELLLSFPGIVIDVDPPPPRPRVYG